MSVLTVRETGITTHRAVGDPPIPSNIEVLFEYDGYEVVKRVALRVPGGSMTTARSSLLSISRLQGRV